MQQKGELRTEGDVGVEDEAVTKNEEGVCGVGSGQM